MALNPNQKKWVFIMLLVVLIALTIFLVKSYLGALFIGALIAYFLLPTYTKLVKKVKYPLAAQLILSIGSVILLFGVITLLALPLVSQTQTLYNSDFSLEPCNDDSIQCSISTKISEFTNSQDFIVKSKDFTTKARTFIYQELGSIFSGLGTFIISFIIVIFSVFYFLGQGKEIKDHIVDVLPLKDSYKNRMVQKLQDTINAVVGGNITTALLQGFFGGLIFFILGLPLSLFWGLLMAVLAFIPAIGPTLIWLPAVIYLIIIGSVVKGIILLVYCIVILGYIEYFLKPKLIGTKLNLSSFAVFLGVIGGLGTFGILGLFIGPIILALLVTSIDIYKGMSA